MTNYVNDTIDGIIRGVLNSKGNGYSKAVNVANIIYKHILDEGGDVISYNKLELAFIAKGRTILVDEDLIFYIKKYYDFVSNSTTFKQSIELVHNMAIRKHGEVKMHFHSIYHNDAIYVGLKSEGMLKITNDSFSPVKIGTDKIYIQANNVFSPSDKSFQPSITTLDTILNAFTFDEDAELSREEQLFILRAWFYYSLFDNGNTMRPILLVMGEPGSGKTLLLKILKGLLYGFSDDRYLPNRLPRDEHELSLFLKNQKFLFIDELNEDDPAIKQILRICATGIEQKFRPKYIANLVSFIPKVWLIINSIDPKVTREHDIAERLLIIKLAQRDERKLRSVFGPEEVMYENLDKCRAYIWKDIVSTIQKIMSNLKENKGGEIPISNYYRNKAFADFCYNAFPEHRELCVKIFNKLNGVQNEHSSEFDPFIYAIEKSCSSLEVSEDGRTKEMRASELLELIKIKVKEFQLDINLPKSPDALTKRIKKLKTTLSKKFKMEIRKDSHSKSSYYSFKIEKEEKEREIF